MKKPLLLLGLWLPVLACQQQPLSTDAYELAQLCSIHTLVMTQDNYRTAEAAMYVDITVQTLTSELPDTHSVGAPAGAATEMTVTALARGISLRQVESDLRDTIARHQARLDANNDGMIDDEERNRGIRVYEACAKRYGHS